MVPEARFHKPGSTNCRVPQARISQTGGFHKLRFHSYGSTGQVPQARFHGHGSTGQVPQARVHRLVGSTSWVSTSWGVPRAGVPQPLLPQARVHRPGSWRWGAGIPQARFHSAGSGSASKGSLEGWWGTGGGVVVEWLGVGVWGGGVRGLYLMIVH